MKVDVSSICKQAVSDARTEAELDAAIGRACRDLYREEGDGVCLAVQEMVTLFARSRNVPRLDAARGFADATVVLDVTVRTSSGKLPPEMAQELLKSVEPGKPYIFSRDARQVWTSDDGTPPPPELATLLESGLGEERRGRIVAPLPGGMKVRTWMVVLILLALVAGACLLAVWTAKR